MRLKKIKNKIITEINKSFGKLTQGQDVTAMAHYNLKGDWTKDSGDDEKFTHHLEQQVLHHKKEKELKDKE